MADLLGKRLGQYELLSVLGHGGMAVVYKARQESMDRDVAVKVISGQLVDNPDFVARFQREAKLIAKLQHPHILPVYDFGKGESLLFLIMRLVEGGSLDDRLRRGALPVDQAARMFTQIASALNYAHDQGIVHRDLKPNNILLDTKDNPYLTDFGIAKLLEENNTSGRLTATGTVMGTPSYMAPEQWRGESIDARTDIYALGIMLYEMLTGDLPFKGDTPYALMYKHFDAPPPSPRLVKPDLPEAVGQLITKALAKDKDQRYASAELMAQDLNAALAGRPINAEIAADNEPTFIGGPANISTRQGHSTEKQDNSMRTAIGSDAPIIAQSSSAAGRLPLIAALAAVVVLIGGGGLFFATRPTAVLTPTITPTETVSILPTTAPTPTATTAATLTPVAVIPTAVRFEDYSDQELNIKFRIPAGFQVQKADTYGLFVTEDYSRLKFSSDGVVTGPPYMQIAIGNSRTFGALEMAKAQTPMDALIAYFGTEQLSNLDQVFGTHFPAATTTRPKPELGMMRKLYVMILGPDRFAMVLVQAPPDQIDNINNNITLPLVRSFDFAVTPTKAVFPTETATPTVVATFVMPTKFDKHESANQSLAFDYPANWELTESKTGIVISSTLGIDTTDLNAPPYITMFFKPSSEIRFYKPQYSIVDLYRDELGFMTDEGKAVEGVQYPTAAGRSFGNTAMKINGWLMLVQLDQDHYITIFAQAPRGSEDSFLQEVLVPMIKSMKYTPK